MPKTFFHAVIAVVALLSGSANAATLITDLDGNLLGATGVVIGNTSFSVAFVDDTCGAVFGDCTDPANFDFTTSADASAAAQALLDQVFVAAFDDSPELTFGCSAPAGFFCGAVIPFDFEVAVPGFVDMALASNAATEAFDVVELGLIDPGVDLASGIVDVFAVFSAEGPVEPVPVPAALPLFLAGLGGIAALRRRNAQDKHGA